MASANTSDYLASGEIDERRGFIRKWFSPTLLPSWGGSFFQVLSPPLPLSRRLGLGALAPGEPLGNQCINKCSNGIIDVLTYVEGITAQRRKDLIYRMLSVKQLPDVDAGGTQAKPTTGIGVEENGPVVKILPEHDVRVDYRSFVVFQVGLSSTHYARAMRVPRKHEVLYAYKNNISSPSRLRQS